jgi:hypothetical protein
MFQAIPYWLLKSYAPEVCTSLPIKSFFFIHEYTILCKFLIKFIWGAGIPPKGISVTALFWNSFQLSKLFWGSQVSCTSASSNSDSTNYCRNPLSLYDRWHLNRKLLMARPLKHTKCILIYSVSFRYVMLKFKILICSGCPQYCVINIAYWKIKKLTCRKFQHMKI